MPAPTLDSLVSLCKRRGFVYPSSTIYGGLANAYDYGPLGAQLLKNIKDLWWSTFIERRSDMVGLDSQIIQHPQTWVTSGHVGSFSDPLVDDTVTNKRYRADHLVEHWIEKQKDGAYADVVVEDMDATSLSAFINEHSILSPDGNSVGPVKEFNLLFETQIGAISGDKSTAYLRGETAQGIFLNFKHIADSTRVNLPFGVGQVGKSFRNEITTGQFVFRTLEFEQAEIEYFFNPESTPWQPLMSDWKEAMWEFVTTKLNIAQQNLRWREHTDAERSFYSKETWDLEYEYPFGFKELWGIAYRTDYDLKQHSKHSGKNLTWRDPHTNEVFTPHVIEPALGINRTFLMVLNNAYREDTQRSRTVLSLAPELAPNQVAVFPLLKNKPQLVALAQELRTTLAQTYRTAWDERGNIGKRYLYQDEIGTPACVTVDFESLEDHSVTVRDRETTDQTRVSISKLDEYLRTTVGLKK